MDPLTAFSLAAGILQFIDFTSKLVRKTYEVCKTGTLSDHVSIEATTLRLTSLAESIQSSSQNNIEASGDSVARSALNNVVAECLDIAKQIDDALLKFKPKNDGQLESARVALRAMFKQKKLEELERQLSRCRQEMLVNFVVLIQSDIGLVSKKLDSLGEKDQAGHKQTQDDLKEAVNKIVAAIETSKSGNLGDADLDEVTRRLRQINIRTTAEQAFLDDLYLPILESRERQIVEAADKTFHWIFDKEHGISGDKDADMNVIGNDTIDNNADSSDTDTNAGDNSLHNASKRKSTGFEDWLSKGKGIFWINGKPGCGKSTIMKYVSKHPRTHAVLQTWAGDSELVTAAAYFWISGDPRQRSLTGLWRSLFYNILSKHPSLIRSLFPWRWRRYATGGKCSEELNDDELFRAMEILSSVMDQSCRFCFFIDGLDEFQGDHKKLIKSLRELAKNDNLKICVSSRPWETFRSSFADDPTVQVDNWTGTDIQNFAKQQLGKHPVWTSLKADTPEKAKKLIDTISLHSSGVFLWVHLVIQELKTAMEDGDTIEELSSRLKVIPPDLNDFFKRMLDNIPSQYRDQTKRYLTLALVGSRTSPLWMYFHTEERVSNFGELATVNPLPVSAALSRFESLKRRVESRCRDLLEVSSLNYGQDPSLMPTSERLKRCFDYHVKITHRSVKDFLLSEGPEYIRDFLTREGSHYEIDTLHDKPILSVFSGLGSRSWRLQSALAEMKRLSFPETKQVDLSIIRYRLLAGSLDRKEPPLAYLEELKRVGELMMPDHEVRWPSIRSYGIDRPFQSFLDMAIAYGWDNYVEQKLMLHDEGLGTDQKSFERLFDSVGMVSIAALKYQRTKGEFVIEWPCLPRADMAAALQNYSKRLYEQRGDAFYWVIESGRESDNDSRYWAKLVQQHRSGEQKVRMTYRWSKHILYRPFEETDNWDGWLRSDCFMPLDSNRN